MKKTKPISTAIYFFAGIIAVAGAMLLTNLFAGMRINGEFGEFTGTLLAAIMTFQMALLIATKLLKYKLVPNPFKPYFVVATKYIWQFHYPIGALGISILLLHLGLTLDPKDLWQSDIVTGCFTSVVILMSAIVGLFYRPKRAKMRTAHIVLAIVAVLPFMLHIL